MYNQSLPCLYALLYASANGQCWKLDIRLKISLLLRGLAIFMVYFYMAPGEWQLHCEFTACGSEDR